MPGTILGGSRRVGFARVAEQGRDLLAGQWAFGQPVDLRGLGIDQFKRLYIPPMTRSVRGRMQLLAMLSY